MCRRCGGTTHAAVNSTGEGTEPQRIEWTTWQGEGRGARFESRATAPPTK
ncbi:hypothetical protein [Enterococcus sp. AZ196]